DSKGNGRQGDRDGIAADYSCGTTLSRAKKRNDLAAWLRLRAALPISNPPLTASRRAMAK
ncbi:MAG: hypothetical protein ACXWCS_19605, partial [Burkholderiales bacterium]